MYYCRQESPKFPRNPLESGFKKEERHFFFIGMSRKSFDRPLKLRQLGLVKRFQVGVNVGRLVVIRNQWQGDIDGA